MTDETTYGTVAAAETVITNAGYVRDKNRHVWVHPTTQRTAKVVHADAKRCTFKVVWD